MQRKLGFTLLELIVAMCIMGILLAIAVPNYMQYVSNSRIAAAKTDLMALAGALSSNYQQTLSYPANSQTSASGIQSAVSGWAPSQTNYFTYSYTYTAASGSATAGVSVSATPTFGSVTNCTWTLNVITNAKTVSSSNSAACPSWS